MGMRQNIKHKRDTFYRKAKEDGYRARSAYKLSQILEQTAILQNTHRVVDLCAAPGSWSQVMADTLDPNEGIVAIDLQEIAPIPGVTCLQGDITDPEIAKKVLAFFDGNKADLVICDGAPDVTGHHSLDEYLHHDLLLAATNITTCVLRPGGAFIAKFFRGESLELLRMKLRYFFSDVRVMKPDASRASSTEAFFVAQNYQIPEGFKPTVDLVELKKQKLPFIPYYICGDLRPEIPEEEIYSTERKPGFQIEDLLAGIELADER